MSNYSFRSYTCLRPFEARQNKPETRYRLNAIKVSPFASTCIGNFASKESAEQYFEEFREKNPEFEYCRIQIYYV